MRVRLAPDDGPPLDLVGGLVGATAGRPDLTVPLGAGTLHPGLINPHDHLHRNHYPRLGTPPYPDAYAWGRDLHERHASAREAAGHLPLREALHFGALKNLLSGVTTCVHHDRWFAALEPPFPLRVARVRVVHSLGFEPDLAGAVRGDAATAGRPLSLHLAEGVTTAMADEVRQADALGLLGPEVLAVHVIAADADGITRLRDRGTAVVWCPSSNLFLFGRTVPPALLGSGVDVLLGTDALLTAAGTMLDELATARRTGLLDDDRLRDAVGAVAARRLGLPAPSLAPGAPADVVLWRRPLFEATTADVALVMVGGRPCYGDEAFADLFARLGVPTEPLVVAGRRRVVAAPLGTAAAAVRALSPECARVLNGPDAAAAPSPAGPPGAH